MRSDFHRMAERFNFDCSKGWRFAGVHLITVVISLKCARPATKLRTCTPASGMHFSTALICSEHFSPWNKRHSSIKKSTFDSPLPRQVFMVQQPEPERWIEAWINGFAFKGQHAKDSFMHAAQQFSAHESFDGFDAESKFAQRQRAFRGKAAARRRSRFSAAVYSGP